jgi:hypothetical protein
MTPVWSNRRAARRVVLGYLAAMITVFAVVAVILAVRDSPDPSFVPVFAIVATMPGSLLIVLLPDFDPPWNIVAASVVMMVAVLVQARLLWLMFRGHRV